MTPWEPPTLRTERLKVRPLGVVDLPAVHAYASAWPAEHFGSWMGATDADSVAHYIADTIARYGRPPRCDLGVTRPGPQGPELIGGVAFRQVWLSPPTIEVGWVFHPDFAGQGYAREALAALVGHLWLSWPRLGRIEARVHAEDDVSRVILERMGFRLEGVLRAATRLHGRVCDGMLYGLLRSDTPPARDVR